MTIIQDVSDVRTQHLAQGCINMAIYCTYQKPYLHPQVGQNTWRNPGFLSSKHFNSKKKTTLLLHSWPCRRCLLHRASPLTPHPASCRALVSKCLHSSIVLHMFASMPNRADYNKICFMTPSIPSISKPCDQITVYQILCNLSASFMALPKSLNGAQLHSSPSTRERNTCAVRP